ncbi:zinc finger protein 142-like isoform X2 [Cylas formicarius]|uniref:zinc finger protein 142-like isoform X2 n=1 Tax=Cylas formicarius TaxID=197179 RepID=UPI002958D46C|nr:zinc finger protein 142-like isoform X2 [Cylas formicarius]
MSTPPTPAHRSGAVEEEASTSVDAARPQQDQDDLPDCKVRRNYTCSGCDFFTQNPRVFLYHLRDVHKEKVRIYECPHCLYASKHFQKLLRHAKMVHGDDVDVDAAPSSSLKRPEENRRRRRDDEGDDGQEESATSFGCSVCDYTSSSRTQLSRHEREYHIKTKFFRCSKCTYVTHIKARYTKHVKYHSMPMIKCDMCDFRTPYKWNLDRHCKNHNGRGVFRCTACNFTADIKQSLTVHEMNHHTPPVGQAAGLAAARRRNKVGGSDAADEDAVAVVVAEDDRPEEATPRRLPSDDVPMAKHHDKLKKASRPVPNLIPIPSKGVSATMSQAVINDICSKSANSSLKDLASLFGSEDVFKRDPQQQPKVVPDLIPAARADFKQKNASFFDKLKEKLELGGGTSASNLICNLCGHESKCLTEHVRHQNACGNEPRSCGVRNPPRLSNLGGSSRCQYCRQRCKSTADLYNHVMTCAEALRSVEEEDLKLEPVSELKIEDVEEEQEEVTEEAAKQPHPMENKVFVWNDIVVPMDLEVDDSNYEYTDDRGDETSLDLSIRTQVPENNNNNNMVKNHATEKVATHGNDISTAQHKRVFKCPHCTFWASTASRFHVHIVGHLNKKPFECSLCSYRSNWRWDITKHIKLKSVRDQAHESARVLMTDETGRRNYTKYNKYLTEIPLSSLHLSSETSGGCGTRPRHLEKVPSSPTRSEKRAGSPVEAAKGAATTTERKRSSDAKRILFKCKRCNYRDASKENLHQHVKEHFKEQYKQQQQQQQQQRQSDNEQYYRSEAFTPCEDGLVPGTSASYSSQDLSLRGTSPDRDERHCRLKHSGDIRVVSNRNGHEKLEVDEQQRLQSESSCPSPPPDPKTEHACSRCAYTAAGDRLLREHSKVHDDAASFNEPPLVWVSRDGKFSKMFKCRRCPHVNVRKVNVLEHEKMHGDGTDEHRCAECDYVCNNAGVLSSHAKVHRGVAGTVHRLVDPGRSDDEQLRELRDTMEAQLRFCGECPARFLKRAEFDIHETLHGAPYTYKCPLCTYAAQDESYLQTHANVHGDDYQRRSDALCERHDVCADHPRPQTRRVGAYVVVVARESPADVPLSGTELFRRREALAAGNPDFVYGTCVKNGRAKEKRYKCHKCPTAFEKREQYRVHLGLHGAKQRYSCDSCDYSVKYYANYVQHVKKHRTSDEAVQRRAELPKAVAPKVFWCASCPYASGRKDAVENHRKRHGSASAYACEHCDYSAPQAHFLRDHARLHFAPRDAGPAPDAYMACDGLRLTTDAGLVFSGTEGAECAPPVADDVAERFNNNAGERRSVVDSN